MIVVSLRQDDLIARCRNYEMPQLLVARNIWCHSCLKYDYNYANTSFINSSISLSVGFRPIARIAHPNSWLVSKIIQHLLSLIIIVTIYLIWSIINQLLNQLVSKITHQSWLLIIIVKKIINKFSLLIIVNNDRLIASTLVFIKPLPSLSNSLKASFNSCFCSIDITELLLMIVFSWTL